MAGREEPPAPAGRIATPRGMGWRDIRSQVLTRQCRRGREGRSWDRSTRSRGKARVREKDLTKVNTPAQASHGGGEGGRIETKSQDPAVSK